MADCTNELLRTVPLKRVVAAALIDTHEDAGKYEETYTHWAARGLKLLDKQTFHTGKRKVTLTINRNTHTATLPPDFHEERMVAFIDKFGRRVPLRVRADIVDTKNIEEIECEDKCEKCNQNKSVCADLSVTEEVTLVNIQGSIYESTVLKKLYPDGRYYLETNIPVWDVDAEEVIYIKDKQFVTELSLKPCGCIEETEENIEKIRCCCYDAYCTHFTDCSPACSTEKVGGYRIFPESGLIQFDGHGDYTKVYMEYDGFMPKKNGQYQVPEVAFETLVNWVKFKSVENKRSVPLAERGWYMDRYKEARRDMDKVRGRIGLSQIIQAVGLIPKFEWDIPVYDTLLVETETTEVESTTDDCAASTSSCSTVTTTTSLAFVPFNIATVVGASPDAPVAGQFVYQNDKLKNAMAIDYIIVNNSIETVKAGEFSIDTVTGIMTRSNPWQDGDILIVPIFFKQS